MPEISSSKPYRIGRSKTGLGLFATQKIKKGTKIIRYFGPLLDSKNKKHDDIDNKYLFEINNRWTIEESMDENFYVTRRIAGRLQVAGAACVDVAVVARVKEAANRPI